MHISHTGASQPRMNVMAANCKRPNEDIYYITTCLEKDRTAFSQACVDNVVKWMKKARTDPTLVNLSESYLRNRDTISMRAGARPFIGST